MKETADFSEMRIGMQDYSGLLFYGGLTVMGISILAALISAGILLYTGRKLRNRLEEEYGKKRR